MFAKKTHHQFWNIDKILKYLNQETKEIIVHASITTRLVYLNRLLYGMSDYIIKRLQRVLNQDLLDLQDLEAIQVT